MVLLLKSGFQLCVPEQILAQVRSHRREGAACSVPHGDSISSVLKSFFLDLYYIFFCAAKKAQARSGEGDWVGTRERGECARNGRCIA